MMTQEFVYRASARASARTRGRRGEGGAHATHRARASRWCGGGVRPRPRPARHEQAARNERSRRETGWGEFRRGDDAAVTDTRHTRAHVRPSANRHLGTARGTRAQHGGGGERAFESHTPETSAKGRAHLGVTKPLADLHDHRLGHGPFGDGMFCVERLFRFGRSDQGAELAADDLLWLRVIRRDFRLVATRDEHR